MIPAEGFYYQVGVPVTHTLMKCLCYDHILDQGVFIDVFSGLVCVGNEARCNGIQLAIGRISDQRFLSGFPYDWHAQILRGDVYLSTTQYKEHPRYDVFIDNTYAMSLKGE